MALETGNYPADLVVTNPDGADSRTTTDDHIRLTKKAMKNALAGFAGGVVVTGTDGGAVNAYTVTPTNALPSYTSRLSVIFSPTVTNTSTATINVSGLGAKDIKRIDGSALVAGDLASGSIYVAIYNGTEFRLMAPTKQYIDQLAFGTALPAQVADYLLTSDGSNASFSNLLKAGTIRFADSTDTTKRIAFSAASITTGTTRTITMPDRDVTLGVVTITRDTRTSNTILGVADAGKLIDVTSGTFTQTITAAATLGAGWFVYYRNSGTGVVTIDPNSTETICGRTTIKVYPKEEFVIQCDGSNFFTIGRSAGPFTITTSNASGAAVDFETGPDDDELTVFEVRGDNLLSSTTAYMYLKVKKGGAYVSSDYQGGTAGSTNYTSISEVRLGDSLLSTEPNGASFVVRVYVADPTNRDTIFDGTAYANNTPRIGAIAARQITKSQVQGIRVAPSGGTFSSGKITLRAWR